jgi:hypothetical protein
MAKGALSDPSNCGTSGNDCASAGSKGCIDEGCDPEGDDETHRKETRARPRTTRSDLREARSSDFMAVVAM